MDNHHSGYMAVFCGDSHSRCTHNAGSDNSDVGTDENVAAAAGSMSLKDTHRDSNMVVVHVEAKLVPYNSFRLDSAKNHIEHFLRDNHVSLLLHALIADLGSSPSSSPSSPFVRNNVLSIRICEARSSVAAESPTDDIVALATCSLDIHVYQDVAQPISHELGQDSVCTAMHWELPCSELGGLWESLVFDEDLPLSLLDYVYTSILFSDMEIDTNIINVNRVILLHGPPGSGKTTLCRALAQKLSIRLADRFSFGRLVEINSHSLFSKFFSESSKLVMQLFQTLHDLLDDQDTFVCILMDEVESLSAARKASAAGLEPSDAIRVVNALLTQIDRLRQRKNVLVLATSNITEAIDVAFIDRADIKQYIGNPSQNAIYQILSSCLVELMEKKLISPPVSLLGLRELDLFSNSSPASKRLLDISRQCEGMSGRALRKLPFLTHARCIRTRTSTLARFLDALHDTVRWEQHSRKEMGCALDSTLAFTTE
ncbi:hypothetical protein BASA50_002098 [Batrachochytrium salamandrivorans]|uniref:AAA+ ATPase domain-containing protein n=1 Tax=Batrachochytrium salamandrivorans TaxID=1357716 RepID=A0ABQ8FQB0_9FUNG|nr:hypothetical protein BASA50_002098 [Batrachochytrium salamandrivorans]